MSEYLTLTTANFRATLEIDQSGGFGNPLEDWDHGCSFKELGYSAYSHYISADHNLANDDLGDLLEVLMDRMDQGRAGGGEDDFETPEERSEAIERSYLNYYSGGLLWDEEDVVEVFKRIVRIAYPEYSVVTDLYNNGNTVVGWSKETSEDGIKGVFQEYRFWAEGDVYFVQIEKAHLWSDSEDETLVTWDTEGTYGTYYGDENAVPSALEILREHTDEKILEVEGMFDYLIQGILDKE